MAIFNSYVKLPEGICRVPALRFQVSRFSKIDKFYGYYFWNIQPHRSTNRNANSLDTILQRIYYIYTPYNTLKYTKQIIYIYIYVYYIVVDDLSVISNHHFLNDVPCFFFGKSLVRNPWWLSMSQAFDAEYGMGYSFGQSYSSDSSATIDSRMASRRLPMLVSCNAMGFAKLRCLWNGSTNEWRVFPVFLANWNKHYQK